MVPVQQLVRRLPLMALAKHRFMLDVQREFGDHVEMRFATRRYLFLNEPDAIGDLLGPQAGALTKGLGLREARHVFGDGLLTSEGKVWSEERRRLRPLFAPSAVEQAAMLDAAAVHLREALPVGSGAIVRLDELLREVALGMVVQAFLPHGVVERADIPVLSRHLRAMAAEPFAFLHTLGMSRRVASLTRSGPTARARAHVGVLVRRLAADPRVTPQLRDHLFGPDLDHDESVRRLSTFLIAGHETTSATASWALVRLAAAPEALARVREELDAGPDTGQPGATPLLDACIAETLRLHPPVWLLSRTVTRDVEAGGHRLRAGQEVLLCPFVLHRTAAHWDRPDDFVPDRFLTDRPRRNTYMPFGLGPRACIGRQLGMAESRMLVVQVLSRVTPLPARRDPVGDAALTLRPGSSLRGQVSRP